MKHHLEPVTIVKVGLNHTEMSTDWLSIEQPLGIRLVYFENGKSITKEVSITMRTPGNDLDLTLGFLFSEGILTQVSQVLRLEEKQKENDFWVEVHLNPEVVFNPLSLERHFYTTSSCGICGKSSLEAVKNACTVHVPQKRWRVSQEIIRTLPMKLRNAQQNFQFSGGIHACGLFDLEGNLLDIQEDIGRHNALDKLIGKKLRDQEIPILEQILLLSGRASFELLQKAAMAGIRMVCALGAPSSLAVELAENFNITLIGFLKEDRFNIYHAPERILS
jgi:FdhD protein